ncbi:hypothetical protein IFM89_033568 [Coptis chinensis]|uniref:ARM repeat superfamily protein n=1 Tax=Coptis chinensis TaxID=261450 RepID=A0A835I6M5_9MAGN|nr:hypothetical protein IFM89_033568 [Coptis chinensis]
MLKFLAIQGAVFLLSTPLARHVVDAAFLRQGRGRQLAALYALGNILGVNRLTDGIMLTDKAEESLRSLIYEIAAKSSKLTPSGLFMSVLKQETEIRLAAYRLITVLVARPWCLMEICAKQEIIGIVTDPHNEFTKNGLLAYHFFLNDDFDSYSSCCMEARYNCCVAINKALLSSNNLTNHPSLTEIAGKLHEAVRRGPYLTRERIEAQPVVVTAERL